jgi:hypothetical protein
MISTEEENSLAVRAMVCFCYTRLTAEYLDRIPHALTYCGSTEEVEFILAPRSLAEGYGMKALSQHTSLRNTFDVDSMDDWIDYVLIAVQYWQKYGTDPYPKVATAIFRELAAIEKDEQGSLLRLQDLIVHDYPGLIPVFCDAVIHQQKDLH